MKLRHGDRGQAVFALQRLLNQHGAGLFLDGDFGDATEQAVRRFQRGAGLVVDGIAGPKTLAAVAGRNSGRLLAQRDLDSAAERLGVPLASVLAVNEVESVGEGFLPNGKPKILFERHIMFRRLPTERAAALAERYPHLVNSRPGGYAGNEAEHQRLAQARQLDETCALESASWGLFQVMGYHWQLLGYTSAAEFAAHMARSEADQLEAFVRFILADVGLHKALKGRRWAEFARRYNGPDYSRNLYDVKLARAYEKHSVVINEGQVA